MSAQAVADLAVLKAKVWAAIDAERYVVSRILNIPTCNASDQLLDAWSCALEDVQEDVNALLLDIEP